MNNQETYETTVQQAESSFVAKQVATGRWRMETIPSEIVGLRRDIQVFRAPRAGDFITHDYYGDRNTFCPPMWWDLGIGSGPCGLGCRACFLMLTFRMMRNPLKPLVYDNVEHFWKAARKWLAAKDRRRQHALGLGIDRSDSLLYEGVTGHARELIPMFASAELNSCGNNLILLTKSKNTHYLEGLPTANVAVTFSLNPEPIADLWEGKWPDTGERITPSISERLLACRYAQDLGFEIRWRIDPILYPPGWHQHYEEFFAEGAALGIRPRYITLGTYREKNKQLDTFRHKWGLPSMEWQPDELVKDGTHRHVAERQRILVYQTICDISRKYLPDSRLSLCKETHSVRRTLRLCSAACNCLN
jgi:DNA repair photolyase